MPIQLSPIGAQEASILGMVGRTPSIRTLEVSCMFATVEEAVFPGIICILLIVIIFLLYFKKSHNTKNKKELYKEIDLFISQNLATVSIQLLLDHFKISNTELYKIMSEKKPGDYIRAKRMKKVKELRSLDASEKEISERTGFSVSYLKKI